MLPINELEQCRYILAVRTFMNIQQSGGDTTELPGTQKRTSRNHRKLCGVGTTKVMEMPFVTSQLVVIASKDPAHSNK